MHRFMLVLATAVACVVWIGADAFAQTNEFQLPPVKLKPDRPTKVKPIPPTPDDREAPKETPPEKTPLKPPEKAPPVLAKPTRTPEKTPPTGGPAEPPAKLPGPAKTPPKSRPDAVREAEEFFGIPKKKPATPPEGPTVTPADLPMPKPVAEPKPKQPAILAVPGEAKQPAVLAVPGKPKQPAVLAVPGEPKRPTLPVKLQAETIEAQIGPKAEADLTGLGEVGLVEEVARTRKAYGRALAALRHYYLGRGAVHKIEWATAEVGAFEKIPKVQYLIVAELAGPDLKPAQSIEAADQLYTEGSDYKEYPAFPPGKKAYLKIALEKFQTIIEKYPQSDKIDDAAFRMGEIYGGWYFNDFARAVQSYQRCWQWNPKSEHPALFNAAKIYDEKLKNRPKAVELYNRVIAETSDEAKINEAVTRLKALTGR